MKLFIKKRHTLLILFVLIHLFVLGAFAAFLPPLHSNVNAQSADRLKVVTTNAILQDIVQNITGKHATVHSIVPAFADPHTYKTKLRDIRNVVYADLAFSNNLFLESNNIIKTINSNIKERKWHIPIAESAAPYGIKLLPASENINLETPWLGFRAQINPPTQTPQQNTPHPSHQNGFANYTTTLTAVSSTGPGPIFAYITDTFGSVTQIFNTQNSNLGSISIPLGSHTHISWAFLKPGIYTLSLIATVNETSNPQTKTTISPKKTITFAVGMNQQDIQTALGRTITPISRGHTDITYTLSTNHLTIQHAKLSDQENAVILVEPSALSLIPAAANWRFLGTPGSDAYILPQSTLGKHTHGSIDPHTWHSIPNVIAYTRLLEHHLSQRDPKNADTYKKNAKNYIESLKKLDVKIRKTLASIPQQNRKIVTTHNSFAYFADEYGFRVSAFLAPNPGVEPSLQQRKKVESTLKLLKIPAVFLEPAEFDKNSVLKNIASSINIRTCRLLGDVFWKHVSTYESLMLHNTQEVTTCLGGSNTDVQIPSPENPITQVEQLQTSETKARTTPPSMILNKGKNKIAKSHVDLHLSSKEENILIKTNLDGKTEFFTPENITFDINNTYILNKTDDRNFDFINAKPGHPVWVIPQTQKDNNLFLGMSIDADDAAENGVNISFTQRKGPGQVSIFTQGEAFAPPNVIYAPKGLNEKSKDIFLTSGSHIHANWVFTRPGLYTLELEANYTKKNTKEKVVIKKPLKFNIKS